MSYWAVRPFDDYFYPRRYDVFDLFEPRHRHRPFDICRRMMDTLANDADWKQMLHSGDIELTEKQFAMNLDVSGYKPEDLKVKVDNGFLTIDGCHEEKAEDGSHYVSRQFSRRYQLPSNTNLEAIKSALVNDGARLRITAPLLSVEAPKEQTIPIEFVGDKNDTKKQ